MTRKLRTTRDFFACCLVIPCIVVLACGGGDQPDATSTPSSTAAAVEATPIETAAPTATAAATAAPTATATAAPTATATSTASTPGATPAYCQMPLTTGPCKGAFKKWGYDAAKKSCVQFTYGGCDGNANQFESESACKVTCVR